ncbi:MAG: hypothetical protein H7066_00520 [Cytophagaceae bacterium]|nr:hypothetical protein [Gemmatimonadaceae bacterium]
MPNLGVFHPQVVHFVIALLVVGVLFRLLALFKPSSWLNPAATALIVLGALASYAAVKTGDDAHGPVERVPGSRDAVVEHEEWGERTRNLFLAIAALELVGLALAPNRQRILHYGTAAIGAAALFAVYETAEHGGELVYGYAGGVGIRSGKPEDVNRLLLAGLYNQAMLDRRDGKAESAAALMAQLGARYPENPGVQIMAVESLLRDAQDPTAARVAVDRLQPPDSDVRSQRAIAMLKAEILLAAGHRDSARTIVEDLVKQVPTNARYKAKLDSLKG